METPLDFPQMMKVSETEYEVAKRVLALGMDLVNMPVCLRIIAELLREDVYASLEGGEACQEFSELVLSTADEVEVAVSRYLTALSLSS